MEQRSVEMPNSAEDMNPARRANLDIRPFQRPLGAEVRCGDVRRLGKDARAAIRDAWLDHLVILIRGQSLAPDDLVEFIRTFGEVELATPVSELPPGIRERPNPYLSMVSNIREGGMPIGTLGDGEVVWHSDMSYHEEPISASMLYAVEVPSGGGQTGFVNMYQAYESLPSHLAAGIESMRIKNDATYNSAGQIRRGMSAVTDVRASPGVVHPAVRTHPETHHNALYLGRRPNAYVQGLRVAESESLLDALWQHATSLPAWFHDWKVGDIVIWDNRCVMHRRQPFDPGARRLLQRAQCKGTRPVISADAVPAPHPRSRLPGLAGRDAGQETLRA
jgi:taurine dioxygenase